MGTGNELAQRGAKVMGIAAGTASATAIAAQVREASAAAAGGVPFVGGFAGWALGEALEQFVVYLGDVMLYSEHKRELIEQLCEGSGRVPYVLAALDALTDQVGIGKALRKHYEEMCELLLQAQLLLLPALQSQPDPEPALAEEQQAAQPTSGWRCMAACVPAHQRAATAVRRLHDAPAMRKLCNKLRKLCSLEAYNTLATPNAVHSLVRHQQVALPQRNFWHLPPGECKPQPATAGPSVPDLLVQIHEKAVPDLASKLRDASGPAIIAIVGNGGTGKTTLASVVYHEVKGQFERAYFMTVGRDVHYHKALHKAWVAIFGSDHVRDFRDENNALDELERHLRQQKMLLVLDDLWRCSSSGKPMNMLDALNFATLPGTEHHGGSKLLITTRDSGTLAYKPHDPDPVPAGEHYPMPPLHSNHAWALFLRHACGTSSVDTQAIPELTGLMKQILRKGGGNPKALQLLGGSVRGCTYQQWKDRLKQYSHAGTADDICRASYDALRPSLQQCIRDLAIFPEDAKIEEPELVHLFATHAPLAGKAADKAALSKLQELVRHSLINVESARDQNTMLTRYSVHDVVYDLARHEVGQGNLAQMQVLGNGTTTVATSENQQAMRELKGPASQQQPLSDHKLSESALRAMRYLSMEGCPSKFAWSKLLRFVRLQRQESAVKLPDNIDASSLLAHLDIIRFNKMEILPQSIGACRQLVHLNVSECCSLHQLPESIGECSQLAHLNVRKCEALTALPDSIGQLAQLTYLNVTACRLQQLPESIGNCRQLAHIDVSECGGLKKLPESIALCESLTRLDAWACCNLEALPENIGNCSQLAHLYVFRSLVLKALPESICNCGRLLFLGVSRCMYLQALPASIGSCSQLTNLDFTANRSLRQLPESIGNCSQLEHLNVGKCWWLTALPESIGGCTQLRRLSVRNCALKALPESIGACSKLTHLDIRGCKALEALPESIGRCCQLTHLDAAECSTLESLPASIGKCSQLTRLDVGLCSVLRALPASIGECSKLTNLDAGGRTTLTALPDSIGRLAHLTHLNVNGCQALRLLPDSFINLHRLAQLRVGESGLEQFMPVRPLSIFYALHHPQMPLTS